MVGVAAGDDHVHTCRRRNTRHLYSPDGSSSLKLLSDEFREVISRLNETVHLVLILKAAAEIRFQADAYLLHAGSHPPCL